MSRLKRIFYNDQYFRKKLFYQFFIIYIICSVYVICENRTLSTYLLIIVIVTFVGHDIEIRDYPI